MYYQRIFFAICREERVGRSRVIILFGTLCTPFQSCRRRLATAGAIVYRVERCFSRISRGPITYSVVLALHLNLDVCSQKPSENFADFYS